MKKIIAILLIFCLTLSLAACSSKGISQSRDDSPSYEGEVVGRDLTGEGGARLFTARTVPLPDPGVKAKMAVRAGDEVFIYAQDDSGENYFYLMGMNSTLSKVELSLYNAVIAMDGESDGTVTRYTYFRIILASRANGAPFCKNRDFRLKRRSRFAC